MQIGEIEVQKSFIISEINQIKLQFAQNEKKLIDKYGKDSVINLQTRSPTKIKTDGKNIYLCNRLHTST